VNFCPSCKTTLSDEQVIAGLCERCKSEVEKRELEQWFFKITAYAERLLKNLDCLPAEAYGPKVKITKEMAKAGINWSEKTKIAQKNWIGKSEGVTIKFKIKGKDRFIDVFTTRPDTIFGATFLVVAPDHPVVGDLLGIGKEVMNYISKTLLKTEEERIAEGKEKTGVQTNFYAINPVNGEEVPIWIADYVVLGYGTGAIMGVPAYDERDLEFAKTYKLKVKKVPLEDMEEIIQKIVENGWGERKVQYRLRDWCISRQRYWGPPIPMIQCKKCGWIPVPEEDLPVKLPYLSGWKPLGTGASPLALAKDWIKTKCPKCGGPAKRETDVSDTFLDSAWYFFRYTSTDKKEVAFDKERVKKWLPVEMYIGGHEHAVLHLMYTRFLTMVFKDLGLIDFEEPFKRFYAHGLLISEGAKMSKSKGNIVIPDEYIAKYGADTLRGYLMFLGPFNQGGDFRDTGIAGMWRFLSRVWRLVTQKRRAPRQARGRGNAEERIRHQAIKKVTEDIQNLRYNTAIASLMEFVNFLTREKKVSRQAIETLVLLLAPFTPHLAEEIWSEVLGNKFSVHNQRWPEYDSKLVKEEMATVVIQINGKLRDRIIINHQSSIIKSQIEKLAKESERVKKYLAGQKIKKTVFIPGKLINFVV